MVPQNAAAPFLFGVDMNSHDLVANLVQQLDSIPLYADEGARQSIIENALKGFANGFDIETFLANHLEIALNDEASPNISDAQYIPIVKSETCSIGIAPVRLALDNLYLSCRYTAFVFNGPVSVDLYEFPSHHRLDVYTSKIRLTRCTTVDVADGGYFAYDGSRFVPDFRGEKPSIAIRYDGMCLSEVSWVFERDQLSPIASIPTDPAVPHKIALISLLSRIGDEQSKKLLIKSASDTNHHVRWAAARALFDLDRGMALEVISKLTEDDHPHISNAARRVMDQVRVA